MLHPDNMSHNNSLNFEEKNSINENNEIDSIHSRPPLSTNEGESKSLIELWLQKYWKTTFDPIKGKVLETDKKMHELIKFLLKTGDDSIHDELIKKKATNEDLLMLMEQINAIMVRIKPGLFTIFT